MAPSETLSTSPATFGKKSRSTDWFEAYSSELAPVTEEEQTALTEYKCRPSRETLQSEGQPEAMFGRQLNAILTTTGCSCMQAASHPLMLETSEACTVASTKPTD